VGADIGKVILFGSIACLVGSLAGWVWGQYVVGPRIKTPPSDEFTGKTFLDGEGLEKLPGTLSSYLPIAIPILLISSQSVAKLALEEGNIILRILEYLGWPVVALAIGVWLAFRNIKKRDDRTAAKDQWVENALRISAMILVVTGLGGSLSAILKGTPAVTTIAEFFATHGLPPLLLPFVIGVVGNMITGSTTVGVITAGSLVAPMLGTLNLSPEAAMLSGASGSVIIKYVNSSYFWVCTSLTKLKVGDAISSFGGVTLVGGVFSFLAVWVMWALGLV
jgi:GntP family gluconate:H+ symporter